MDWETVFAELLTILERIIIVIVIPCLAKLVKEKIHNDKLLKYVDKGREVIEQCVDFTNQTFVDGLKAEGKFDKEAAKTAFKMSKDYVLLLLNEKTKEAIIEVFGDLELWMNTAIENAVRTSESYYGTTVN